MRRHYLDNARWLLVLTVLVYHVFYLFNSVGVIRNIAPPGIPILAPGEKITGEILDYIKYAKAKGCSMTGPEDPTIEHINVLA